MLLPGGRSTRLALDDADVCRRLGRIAAAFGRHGSGAYSRLRFLRLISSA